MILTLEEAKEILRVDGNDLDLEIASLVDAIPSYLEATTGYLYQKEGKGHQVARTAAKFLLILWFDEYGNDKSKIQRTIDNLLTVLSTIARGN